MQGDIFQLESLTPQVAVPKPQSKPAMAYAGQTSDPVAIYNEDDLSHLLYVSSNPHHHHHHRHHRHHEQTPYTHPADVGTIFINTIMDDGEATTPALSDCDSCYGSETSGASIESPVTPPLSTLDDIDGEALEAYRRKGRRNAFSTDLQDGFGFPIFLGRQDEEDAVEEWPLKSLNPPQEQQKTTTPAVKTTEIPPSQHLSAVEGPMMSWWPEPLDTMEDDWTVEKTQWQLQQEKEKLRERKREGGVIASNTEKRKIYEGAAPVGDIQGQLMSWWPTPLYDWSEHFYE
ncbi:hypothetical protein GGR55DRAFT_36889 [Xylaria sp. FL0064]|nr:hypothetical protein GGR55DRAFT_36889 [Xylaria sp. FL0064]